MTDRVHEGPDNLPGREVKILFDLRVGHKKDLFYSCRIDVDMNHISLPIKKKGGEIGKCKPLAGQIFGVGRGFPVFFQLLS